jgi:hypothetical protein
MIEVDTTDENEAVENAQNFLEKTIDSAPNNAIEDNSIIDKPWVKDVSHHPVYEIFGRNPEGVEVEPGEGVHNPKSIVAAVSNSNTFLEKLGNTSCQGSIQFKPKFPTNFQARTLYDRETLIQALKTLDSYTVEISLAEEHPVRFREAYYEGDDLEYTDIMVAPKIMDTEENRFREVDDLIYSEFFAACQECDWSDYYDDRETFETAIDDHRWYTGHDEFVTETAEDDTE